MQNCRSQVCLCPLAFAWGCTCSLPLAPISPNAAIPSRAFITFGSWEETQHGEMSCPSESDADTEAPVQAAVGPSRFAGLSLSKRNAHELNSGTNWPFQTLRGCAVANGHGLAAPVAAVENSRAALPDMAARLHMFTPANRSDLACCMRNGNEPSSSHYQLTGPGSRPSATLP